MESGRRSGRGSLICGVLQSWPRCERRHMLDCIQYAQCTVHSDSTAEDKRPAGPYIAIRTRYRPTSGGSARPRTACNKPYILLYCSSVIRGPYIRLLILQPDRQLTLATRIQSKRGDLGMKGEMREGKTNLSIILLRRHASLISTTGRSHCRRLRAGLCPRSPEVPQTAR